MDKQGREYLYQRDWTVGNQMFHVRCDDYAEFQTAVKNMESMIDVMVAVTKPLPAGTTPINPTQTVDDGIRCDVCQQPLLPEKRIVSSKTGKAYWVRNCISGDRTHKGLIRPAE